VSHLVFAEPDRDDARELLARTFEQLAYVQENGVWRNFYLSGAKELIEGPPEPTTGGTGAAIASALSVDQLFDVLAVRLDGPRAEGLRRTLAFNFTDAGPYTLVLRHSVLHTQKGTCDPDAAVTITCAASFLGKALRGEANLLQAIEDGSVSVEGDLNALFEVLLLLETPRPTFPIVEP
jgi:alkyl sulfatase BDS1-like metallo-beta-lactamase superfamily hydrolase